MSAHDGFSLPELLVALMLTLVVTAAIVGLIVPAGKTSSVQPDAIDLHQRARAAVEAIARDLLAAGAGRDVPPAAGPLSDYLAAIVPRRLGIARPDPVATARADVVSILRAPRTLIQTTLGQPLASAASDLIVTQPPSCPRAQPACGITVSTRLLVFDPAGWFDLFDVTSVSGTTARVKLLAAAQSHPYPAGAPVIETESDIYYLDTVSHQLRHDDGGSSDMPVVDRVTGLSIEYFGDPAPPVRPVPPLGTANCLYDAVGAPRPLATLAAQGGSLALLPLSMLRDGPWCGGGSTIFDADVLRVRRVRVTVRLQAAAPVGSMRALPDEVVTFDVTPRNLNLSFR
jgi:prepilin-type N-terminal cleavage/methylation domain-containing protein